MPHFHIVEVIQIVNRFGERLTAKMRNKFLIMRNQLDRFGDLDFFAVIDKCISSMETE